MSNASLSLPQDLEKIVGSVPTRPDDLTVACYTFPQFHQSAFNDRLYAPGWTEFPLMRGARPWFPGHHQPRQPLLGELDEAKPSTWQLYNGLAADHGIDVFIWDWYWFGDEPVLHEALEQGFLQAPNHDRLKFAIMWCNHPLRIKFPTTHTDGTTSYLLPYNAPDSREDVWRSLSMILARYCHRPTYWRIDGKPVVVIWETQRLMTTFGLEGTRELLDDLRHFGQKLGHPGIHFHASQNSNPVFHQLETMGFDSYGLYNPILMAAAGRPHNEELADYGAVAADVVRTIWPEMDGRSPLPCFPSVSPGWDASPRNAPPVRPSPPDRTKWPGSPPIVVNETPGAFEAMVRAAFAYLQSRPTTPRILTIGCWNEWTEGQYLLPDTRLGNGMLKALGKALERLPAEGIGRYGWASRIDLYTGKAKGQGANAGNAS